MLVSANVLYIIICMNIILTNFYTVPETPTLSDLIVELYSIADKWYILGKELGLSDDQLKEIETIHTDYPDRCLINMLDTWLNYTVDPSWETIIESLKSSQLQENGIAYYITHQYLL